MTVTLNRQCDIILTDKGLMIDQTRITLYDVMIYLKSNYPPKFIASLLNLTDYQIKAALAYIETHQAEVEAEYEMILQEADEVKQYWEKRNQENLARIAKIDPKPGTEVLWAKLKEQKARHETEKHDFFN